MANFLQFKFGMKILSAILIAASILTNQQSVALGTQPELTPEQQARIEFLNSPATNQIEPFSTDGCSKFPDGTMNTPHAWYNCCVNHDKAYWMGGSRHKKELADEMLRACVASAGNKTIGRIMKFGVRLFGGPLNFTPFRWGYGWSYPIGYSKLNRAQIQSVQQQIEEWENSKLSSWVPNPETSKIVLPETE